MKEIGQVKEYNGYNGKIVNRDGKEFLLLKEQIVDNESLKNLDEVEFVPEKFVRGEISLDIARFVKTKKYN